VAPSSCVAASAGDGSIRVSWNRAPADQATNFVIRRSRNAGAMFWTGRRASSPWTNTGLAPGTYRYSVEAINNTGRSTATTCGPNAGVTIGAVNNTPKQPVSCWATRVNGSQIRITWTKAAADNATDYVIRRSRNGGTFFWAGVATGTPWLNNGVGPGTYAYSVAARNGAGQSTPTTCGPNAGVTL